MARVYNFSAGPAMLPEEVLKQASEEMLDYHGCGMSVMEMSHRSAEYDQIHHGAMDDLRSLMNIPDNYRILFLQGGDSLIFASVFMNLATNGKADYIVTGNWSNKAFKEADILGDAKIVASGKESNFSQIPDLSDLPIREDASYVYICQNETVHGNRIWQLPNTKGHVLVADQSSMFLSEPVDVSKFGVIHAGVQKNVGPAGVQIVIIREDLIPDDLPGVPTMLRYKTHADKDSLYNTPPCYNIYICSLVFKWIKSLGGLEAMKERNERKAKVLYDFLDSSKLFKGTVAPKDRSIMNVPFVTGDDEMDKKFIAEATAHGFVNIKGHRSVGGMRASIYNAMPPEGVDKLVEFMADFEKANK
ncbi:MAG: 3-phosphoserine/phosphohydroxythreonine transaminase [Coriobacteriales bacterium]|nr:3-phosphoserine/phosphohydroxythreonine transaminase [Coriobacteriales bacterium]